VGDVARREHGVARPGEDRLIVDLDGELAFEDVERFLFPSVDVRRHAALRVGHGVEQGKVAVALRALTLTLPRWSPSQRTGRRRPKRRAG
jgi:hypothetical protein